MYRVPFLHMCAISFRFSAAFIVCRIPYRDRVTATLFLPLAFLLANMRFPAVVLLRFRKPCFRSLFFLFIFISWIIPHSGLENNAFYLSSNGESMAVKEVSSVPRIIIGFVLSLIALNTILSSAMTLSASFMNL